MTYKVRVYYTGYFDAEVTAESAGEAIEAAEYIDFLDSEEYRNQFFDSLEVQPNETMLIGTYGTK